MLRDVLSLCRSEYGDLIRSYIKEGNIVPMEVTIKLLQNAMTAVGSLVSFPVVLVPRRGSPGVERAGARREGD